MTEETYNYAKNGEIRFDNFPDYCIISKFIVISKLNSKQRQERRNKNNTSNSDKRWLCRTK